MIPNRCIILCSGTSVRNQDYQSKIKNLSIWNVIKNEFVLSANFNYKWHIPTALMFSDYQFYSTQKVELDKFPLLISFKNGFYEQKETRHLKGNNLYLVKPSSVYREKESWSQGFYCSQLVSLFMLTFAIALGCKEIYLLGNDACEIDGRTHFYDEIDGTYYWERHKHCGVGKNSRGFYRTGNFNKIKELNEVWYKPYEQVTDVKIFNVSLKSVIDTFPKISYTEFYDVLKNKQAINQDEIRKEIIEKINETKKN